MSLERLTKVKEFLIRIIKDPAFRAQLQADAQQGMRKVMEENGYGFSKEEFETAAIQILDLNESGEFHELNADELVAAIGGIVAIYPDTPTIQPMYGVVYWPPEPHPYPTPKPYPRPCSRPCPKPRPIDIQPMYGVIIDPIVQPMYGVIIAMDQ
jgi:hypothetical protein